MWPRLKTIARTVGIAMVVVAMLSCGYVGLTWQLRVPSTVGLEARFQRLPDNDKALAIRTQPNVFRTVWIARVDPDRKRLVVWIPVSYHLWLHTPIPDLDSNVSRFGYLEPDGPFRPSAEDSLSDAVLSDDP
jgi:hypothetical protein